MAEKITQVSAGVKVLMTLFFEESLGGAKYTSKGEGVNADPTQLIAEAYFNYAMGGIDLYDDEKAKGRLAIFKTAGDALYNCKKYRQGLQNEQRLIANKKTIIVNMMLHHIKQNKIEKITMDDVKAFVTIATENRKISDRNIKKYLGYLLNITWPISETTTAQFTETMSEEFFMPVHEIIREKYNISYELYQALLVCREEKYDNNDDREKIRYLYCEIEKENWKLLGNKENAYAIEEVDLYTLKQLLADKTWEMFRLLGRQAELGLAMKRFTMVVGSRRIWKTEFAAYLGSRQLILPYNIITYIVPTLSRHARSPYRKFKQRLKNDYDISPLQATRQILNRATESELQFYSTERGDWVRSDESNVLIYDEAAYLDKSDYDSAFPIVMSVDGFIYAISTFNIKQPQNWFYYKVLEGEVEKYNSDSSKYTIRVPLSENPFMSEQNKKLLEEEFKSDPQTYAIEYLCEAQSWKTFNLDSFREVDTEYVEKKIWVLKTIVPHDILKYEGFIICYDPGKAVDQAGYAVIWLRKDNKGNTHPVVIIADYATHLDYMSQVEFMGELYSILKKIGKTDFLLELNNTGQVLTELLTEKKIPHTRVYIHWTINEPYTYDRDMGRFILQRDYAVKILQMSVMGKLKAKSYLNKLRIEVEGYDPSEEGKSKRQKLAWWGKHHFDIIGALRMGAWRCKRLNIGRSGDAKETRSEKEYINSQFTYENGLPLLRWQDKPSTRSRIIKYGY